MLFRFEAPRAGRPQTVANAARLLGLLTWLTTAPLAVAQDRGLGDWSTPDDQCVPSCRDGYECHQGECAPVCNPSCGPGMLCTGGGECVRVESVYQPAPSASRRTGDPNQCLPACRSGFTCLDGACVSLCNPVCPRGELCSQYGECLPDPEYVPERRAVERTASAPRPPDPTRDTIVALHADALGSLQFGVTPTVEVGEKYAGYARLRPLNTGVASYFLLGHDDEDEFDWGVGGALGFHAFSARDGNLRGFFGGPALEYAFVKTRDTKRDFATYRTHLLVPQVDFGYRWGFRSFLLGLGMRLGVAVPVHERAEPRGSQGCRRADSCDRDLDATFLPGVFLDLGYFVPRR